jgi:cytochrome c peroxidase
VLFTNSRVRHLSEAIDEGTTPLPDPDPPLNALEQQGKVVFTRACAQCHGGPSQSTPQPTPLSPVVRFHSIATTCPRPVDTVTPPRWLFAPCPPSLARNARTYELKLANGTTVRRTSSDPGRALLTGFVNLPIPTDDWEKFDNPGLRGISKTAPYFHNNSAATLEDVVAHYVAFFQRLRANAAAPGVAPPVASTDGVHFDRIPLPEEIPALLAYLRKL